MANLYGDLNPNPLFGLSLISATFGFSSFAIDANNDAVGFVFLAPNLDAITHGGFRYGARTGTPPPQILALESVDAATGLPSGTVLGGGSPASVIYTPPADTTWNGLWRWLAFDNSYTPSARGEKIALTIRYSSGTVDGSNNSSYSYRQDSLGMWRHAIPYPLTNAAGTWTKQAPRCPMFAIRSASSRWGFPFSDIPFTAATTIGHRQAMAFTLPSGAGDTFEVQGLETIGNFSASTGLTVKMAIWDTSSNVLQSITVDNDVFAATGLQTHIIPFSDTTLATLNFGTKYYIGFEVVEASGSVGVARAALTEADDLLAYPIGTAAYYASFDGSTWTEDQTKRPLMRLLFDDVTEPAGGGGAIVNQGLHAIESGICA